MPVLWGGCTADEGTPAYWPWRRILRSWLGAVGRDRAAAALDGLGEVARLAPELPGEPVESDRFALFDAVARFVAAVAEEAGLVLVLDDLQWADADSMALLAHVTREVTRARLLVVATVRPAERDIALGGGLTNRQIAATAHISERTVETHVGHVLAKLGFTRRSEIAAWVAARGQ